MVETLTSPAALWGAVLLFGLYHGINPGMGWPLAVSSALMERRGAALWRAMGLLTLGHFLAMTAILLPFSLMVWLVAYETAIRLGAAGLVVALGLYLLVQTRHPRFLARVKPAQLGLWSFLVALAHGAGLMLVPIYLGLCAPEDLDAGHRAAGTLMGSNTALALLVALAHTAAMALAGAAIAFGVYRWIGLKFLTQGWFNLDKLWAASLILVGALGLATA